MQSQLPNVSGCIEIRCDFFSDITRAESGGCTDELSSSDARHFADSRLFPGNQWLPVHRTLSSLESTPLTTPVEFAASYIYVHTIYTERALLTHPPSPYPAIDRTEASSWPVNSGASKPTPARPDED